MSRRIVVATGNPHKVTEIGAILAEAGVDADLVAMSAYDVPAPIEDGDTFAANALIKAHACAAATGYPSIADDSGLEVDALDGAPGVYSARYAGTDATDADNNRLLLDALADVAPDRRTARFVAALALVLPDGTEVVRHGRMEGRVLAAPQGQHGFGYDPLFVPDAVSDGRSAGQLSPAEKDAISHRGAAVRALVTDLQRLLAS